MQIVLQHREINAISIDDTRIIITRTFTGLVIVLNLKENQAFYFFFNSLRSEVTKCVCKFWLQVCDCPNVPTIGWQYLFQYITLTAVTWSQKVLESYNLCKSCRFLKPCLITSSTKWLKIKILCRHVIRSVNFRPCSFQLTYSTTKQYTLINIWKCKSKNKKHSFFSLLLMTNV